LFEEFGVSAAPKDHLQQATAVAQIYKNQAAVVAPGMHPAFDHHFLADLINGPGG